MKLLFTIAFLIFSTIGFTQSNAELDMLEKKENPTEIKTVTVNTATYSPNEIGGLKDDLIKLYTEELTHPTYDEANQTFTFTYNNTIKKDDLKKLFKKYRVSFPQ